MGHIWLLCETDVSGCPFSYASRSFEKIEAEIIRQYPNANFDELNRNNPEYPPSADKRSFRINCALIENCVLDVLCCYRFDDCVKGDFAYVFCMSRNSSIDPNDLPYTPPSIRPSLHDCLELARYAFLQMFLSECMDTEELVGMIKNPQEDDVNLEEWHLPLVDGAWDVGVVGIE